jgi:hypothetical protein
VRRVPRARPSHDSGSRRYVPHCPAASRLFPVPAVPPCTWRTHTTRTAERLEHLIKTVKPTSRPARRLSRCGGALCAVPSPCSEHPHYSAARVRNAVSRSAQVHTAGTIQGADFINSQAICMLIRSTMSSKSVLGTFKDKFVQNIVTNASLANSSCRRDRIQQQSKHHYSSKIEISSGAL